mgnify:FL=1|tara:strand:+ start:1555 stop:1848 length:294 start_codon:yes stop_codon:yes gene_type:complete
MKNNFRNNSKSNPRQFETCVTVHAEECNGDAERMVRRFSKKVKREGILEEARDRAHFTKPSIIAAERKKATKRLIRNVNRKREELCTPRDRVIRRRR